LQIGLCMIAHGQTVAELVAKGCPSPDKLWLAKDYTAFHQLLIGGTIPLLRLNSEGAGMIFRRYVDTANLTIHTNRDFPLNQRMDDLMTLQDATKGVMLFYMRAANHGEKVEKEFAELLVFQLAVGGAACGIANEFLPTIPKDEKYEVRMAGLAKVKLGLT